MPKKNKPYMIVIPQIVKMGEDYTVQGNGFREGAVYLSIADPDCCSGDLTVVAPGTNHWQGTWEALSPGTYRFVAKQLIKSKGRSPWRVQRTELEFEVVGVGDD